MFKRWNFKSAAFRRMRVEAKRNDGWTLYKSRLKEEKAKKATEIREKLEKIGKAQISEGEKVVLDPNKQGWLRTDIKVRIKNLSSKGKFHCQECGSDLWMVMEETYIYFRTADFIYCQNCGKLLHLSELGFFKGYINYNDFKKLTKIS